MGMSNHYILHKVQFKGIAVCGTVVHQPGKRSWQQVDGFAMRLHEITCPECIGRLVFRRGGGP